MMLVMRMMLVVMTMRMTARMLMMSMLLMTVVMAVLIKIDCDGADQVEDGIADDEDNGDDGVFSMLATCVCP